MKHEHIREAIYDFAKQATEMGFQVYVVDVPGFCYACYSDETGERVAYVQIDTLAMLYAFSGEYLPGKAWGSGWRIADYASVPSGSELREILYANAPRWARNPDPIYLTLEKYLKAHPGYKLYEVTDEQK